MLRAFLKSVDSVAPDDDIIEAMVAKLAVNGITGKEDLIGCTEEEVGAVWDASGPGPVLGRVAFLRRAARLANMQAPPTSVSTSSQLEQSSSQSKVQATSEMVEMLGATSALEIAQQLAGMKGGGTEMSTVQDYLGESGMEALPFWLVADDQVFRALKIECIAAEKSNKVPFTFVDLTSRHLLPLWLPTDAIGGRFVPDHAPAAGTNTEPLQALGSALRSSMPSSRSFKSIQQWISCYLKYMVAVVCSKQWTLPQAVAHLAIIMRLSEEGRGKRDGGLLAVVYDCLIRQTWSQRCKAGERINFEEVTQKVHEDVLDAARAKLRLQDTVDKEDPSRLIAHGGAQAAALAKQLDATKKELAQARRNQDMRTAAASQPGVSSASPRKQENNESYSGRQLKRHQRFQQLKSWKSSSSGYGGKKGKNKE